MNPLDFAFGLGCWGITKGDFVEAQGRAKLGEGIGMMGKEEGVVIDVERERQADGQEGGGEEVEMSQKRFAWVDLGQWQKAAVIVDDLQQREIDLGVGKPSMRGSIILPELADLLNLPTADRLARACVFGVW